MAFQHRIRNVTAVLGPTNTGKTHLAIERMLGHQSGMIGLPLRLLAREVYDKVVARVGPSAVALVTGEEKIKPDNPRFWVSTVEAMPREVDTDFLAVDEIQLAADPDRGHVFTDRLQFARGRSETLLLGAGTMREAISDLIPDANFISRPRLSKITYSGQKKMTRLPKRSAIVAFSAAEVYSIAELIRRQLGGAAVVLGALSPRTRNAQVALYQSGDVDYLVATDAIGMGLNLDVDHVAFAAVRKFDGHVTRNLTPAELSQIAGRAGRHMNDGTFGVTGDAQPFEPELIEQLETHTFDTVRVLQWRNRNLDFASVDRLRESLKEAPRHMRLQRARMADDLTALETVSADRTIAERAQGTAAVSKLWDVCQVPDYRKISAQSHAEMVAQLYGYLTGGDERIPEDWFAEQVARADRTDGDIDTLATRIAHIRTWTFVSNRGDWLRDPVHWQERTRAIEDSLSDALHEQLTQRFVDRRTSALMKGLRDKDDMVTDIGADGAVTVENHYVGRLKGFRFQPDAQSETTGIHGKTSRNAAAHVLSKELAMRARRVAAARPDAFKLGRNARILWRDEEIARLEPGDDPLKPTVVLIADEHLSGPDKEKVQARLDTWVGEIVTERLKALAELKAAEDITGLARGIAFRLTESFGILKRDSIADEMRQLDQPARAQLRKYGVRFGAFNIFLPPLLKPAPAELTLALWTLKDGPSAGLALDALPEPPRAGLTSVVVDPAVPEAFYRAAGYHLCGPRAIRVDMLERLADSIRPLLAWRASEAQPNPPRGSSGDGGFMVTPEMMSILGCSSAELGSVLGTLGFRSEMQPAPKPRPVAATAPAIAPATEPEATSDAMRDADGALPEEMAGDGAATEADGTDDEAVPVLAGAGAPGDAVADLAAAAQETAASQDGEAGASAAPGEAAVAAGPAGDVAPAGSIEAPDFATGAVNGTDTGLAEAPEAAHAEAAAETPAMAEAPELALAEPDAQSAPEGGAEAPPAAPTEAAQVADAASTADTVAAAEGAPSDAAAEAETEAETVAMVEVWRPRRRHREDRRPRRHDQRRGGESRSEAAPATATDTREGEGAQARSGERDRRRGGDRPQDRERGRPAGDRPRPEGGREGQQARSDRGGDQRRGGDDKRGGGDKRGEGRRDDGRRNEGRRDDRRRDDRGPRPQVRSASPQRSAAADPDSPFAALGALKLELEKQSKSSRST